MQPHVLAWRMEIDYSDCSVTAAELSEWQHYFLDNKAELLKILKIRSSHKRNFHRSSSTLPVQHPRLFLVALLFFKAASSILCVQNCPLRVGLGGSGPPPHAVI